MAKLKVKIEGEGTDSAKTLIRLAAKAAYNEFGYDRDGFVYIQLVDGEEIRELNSAHRKVDKVTDVLSFPMMDYYRGECRENMPCLTESGELEIGDMVICTERAREQAREFGHSFSRECAYLTVHSILHLLGFDHVDEGAEKAAMREKEEKILKKLGLERK
ncbi:MAG: rRNA maturation RNase YbeY [Clostridia bacterium]|nr:rRNA maturation RNase YbeY [Clostridia bacterium]MBR4955733.1 rRNA maturation RNase YbeY [Clostridia bacterium]MBR5903275.1 rRNA maturation RNase YbeY [Clostridia bacterium]